MADLEKMSSELFKLRSTLMGNSASGQLSPLERVRLVPKTLQADMLKTIPELRRLRLEDANEESHLFISMMNKWVWGVEVEDNFMDSYFLHEAVVLLRQFEEDDAQQEIRSRSSS